MCVWVVARLRQRLKLTFFEIFSSLKVPFGDPLLEKVSKNVDFSLWGKHCIVLPKWTFFRVLAHCVLLDPHCQDPSPKIPPPARSVKVLPFLASLMSFHQRVFLTRQIVFGEFFYAFYFFFFLCARLLLFLFTHFCVCLLCLFGKLKMTGYVKMLYKYSDSIF